MSKILKKVAQSGNIAAITKLLDKAPALTDYDFGMYIKSASIAKKYDKARDGWECIRFVYGRTSLNPHPEWTSKVAPTNDKITHHSYFCIYIDALGYSNFTLSVLKEEWEQVEEWHRDAGKKYVTNLCTSYVEALLRKGAYEDASRFVFGNKDQLDVVTKYKIPLDGKFIRTYVSFFKNIHKDSTLILERFRKKWPKLEIDLKNL